MEIDIMQILGWLAPLLTGGAIGMLTKSGRIKSKSDAYKAMAEAYEYRIKGLHESIETCNTTISELQSRVASLNHALDDKTDIIRRYVADIMKAEGEVNRVNDRLSEAQTLIAEKEREIADLRVALEYVLEWRCEHPDCNDPRGRRPPNGKLCGQTFRMPAIVERYRTQERKGIDLGKEVSQP